MLHVPDHSLTDINECENDTHNCLLSDHKVCIDTIGSHACICQDGYNNASDICEGTLVSYYYHSIYMLKA